jgi:DNA-binding XRE family transcriptional regulator
MKQNLKLLLAIRKRDMRQVDFARLLNIHATTLSAVINGRLNLSTAQKEKYARTLGVKVEEIFDNE